MKARVEYSKAHITARIVRLDTSRDTSGTRSGGIIELLSRPRTILLTSDIVYICSTIYEHDDWYVKKIFVTPADWFRFKLLCPNHGIDFTGIVHENEILEIEVRLCRFKRFRNVQKIVPRSVFKIFNSRVAKVVSADIDIQVLTTSLDRRLHYLYMREQEKNLTLVIKNFQVNVIGKFRILCSTYRSRIVLYFIGENCVQVCKIYRVLDKMIELCKVCNRNVRNYPCTIIVI